MTEVLNQIGLFVATENDIQILDPNVKNRSVKLREQSEIFLNSKFCLFFFSSILRKEKFYQHFMEVESV